MSEAALGSGKITTNIAAVAEAAQDTTREATNTQKASQQLVEMSTQLRNLMGQFKIKTNNGTDSAGDSNSEHERDRSGTFAPEEANTAVKVMAAQASK